MGDVLLRMDTNGDGAVTHHEHRWSGRPWHPAGVERSLLIAWPCDPRRAAPALAAGRRRTRPRCFRGAVVGRELDLGGPTVSSAHRFRAVRRRDRQPRHRRVCRLRGAAVGARRGGPALAGPAEVPGGAGGRVVRCGVRGLVVEQHVVDRPAAGGAGIRAGVDGRRRAGAAGHRDRGAGVGCHLRRVDRRRPFHCGRMAESGRGCSGIAVAGLLAPGTRPVGAPGPGQRASDGVAAGGVAERVGQCAERGVRAARSGAGPHRDVGVPPGRPGRRRRRRHRRSAAHHGLLAGAASAGHRRPVGHARGATQPGAVSGRVRGGAAADPRPGGRPGMGDHRTAAGHGGDPSRPHQRPADSTEGPFGRCSGRPPGARERASQRLGRLARPAPGKCGVPARHPDGSGHRHRAGGLAPRPLRALVLGPVDGCFRGQTGVVVHRRPVVRARPGQPRGRHPDPPRLPVGLGQRGRDGSPRGRCGRRGVPVLLRQLHRRIFRGGGHNPDPGPGVGPGGLAVRVADCRHGDRRVHRPRRLGSDPQLARSAGTSASGRVGRRPGHLATRRPGRGPEPGLIGLRSIAIGG